MNFGEALRLLKDGKWVARSGWNGKGMFAYLVPAASYPAQTGAAKTHFGENAVVPYRASLALKTVDDDVATWVPSCSDVLADDWISLDAGTHDLRETSSRVSTIAARLAHFGYADLLAAVNHTEPEHAGTELVNDIRTLAASCLSQDETPENTDAE